MSRCSRPALTSAHGQARNRPQSDGGLPSWITGRPRRPHLASPRAARGLLKSLPGRVISAPGSSVKCTTESGRVILGSAAVQSVGDAEQWPLSVRPVSDPATVDVLRKRRHHLGPGRRFTNS